MNLDEIINSMTPEVYQRLSTAVELGKWPDGVALTPETERKQPATGDAMAGAAQYRSATYDDRYSRSDGDEKQAAAQSGFRYYVKADCDIENAVTGSRIRGSRHSVV